MTQFYKGYFWRERRVLFLWCNQLASFCWCYSCACLCKKDKKLLLNPNQNLAIFNFFPFSPAISISTTFYSFLYKSIIMEMAFKPSIMWRDACFDVYSLTQFIKHYKFRVFLLNYKWFLLIQFWWANTFWLLKFRLTIYHNSSSF